MSAIPFAELPMTANTARVRHTLGRHIKPDDTLKVFAESWSEACALLGITCDWSNEGQTVDLRLSGPPSHRFHVAVNGTVRRLTPGRPLTVYPGDVVLVAILEGGRARAYMVSRAVLDWHAPEAPEAPITLTPLPLHESDLLDLRPPAVEPPLADEDEEPGPTAPGPSPSDVRRADRKVLLDKVINVARGREAPSNIGRQLFRMARRRKG